MLDHGRLRWAICIVYFVLFFSFLLFPTAHCDWPCQGLIVKATFNFWVFAAQISNSCDTCDLSGNWSEWLGDLTFKAHLALKDKVRSHRWNLFSFLAKLGKGPVRHTLSQFCQVTTSMALASWSWPSCPKKSLHHISQQRKRQVIAERFDTAKVARGGEGDFKRVFVTLQFGKWSFFVCYFLHLFWFF